jgi:hypothetical protein
MLNGVENGTGTGGTVNDVSDDMIYILGFNYVCDMVDACGNVTLDPWFIRDETASAGASATHETWYGVDMGASLMGVGLNVDIAKYDHASFSGTAWYVGANFELEALESVPGIQSGNIHAAVSDTDEEFFVPGVNSAGGPYGNLYHNSVGFADVLGPAGIWTTDTDTWNVGVGISPSEGWNGSVSLIYVETAGVEFDEIDISLGTQLNGNVGAWFGYAWIDPDASDNQSVFWTTLDLSF